MTATKKEAARVKPSRAKEKEKVAASATKHGERLRPGELNGLVLSHMCEHEGELPLTASAIAKAIGKSSGAVANCLARLAPEKKVRLATKTPRPYDLKGVSAR